VSRGFSFVSAANASQSDGSMPIPAALRSVFEAASLPVSFGSMVFKSVVDSSNRAGIISMIPLPGAEEDVSAMELISVRVTFIGSEVVSLSGVFSPRRVFSFAASRF